MSQAVDVLKSVITVIDHVYIATFIINEVPVIVSLLDILEIIFGVNVIAALGRSILKLNDGLEERR